MYQENYTFNNFEVEVLPPVQLTPKTNMPSQSEPTTNPGLSGGETAGIIVFALFLLVFAMILIVLPLIFIR